jgi:hypothetical protein
VQEKLRALSQANAHAVELTNEMSALSTTIFAGIVASQEEEARKAVLKEAKDEYQQNKDDVAEITLVLTAMDTAKTEL